jgi:hypothetical protein
MNDRTIPRAARAGVKTIPVEKRVRPKRVRNNVRLTPDEIALAVNIARADRIEQDTRDYAYKKRTA